MSAIKTGGPAFPVGEQYQTADLAGNVTKHSKGALHNGMTLRDYFAAKVAAGDAACESGWGSSVSDETIAMRAQLYYRVADAMLKAREAC